MIVHIDWIEKSGDEIRNETYRLNRIITAITNVETVFSPDRKDTVENMKIILNILNTIINEEEEAGYVNDATLTSAKNILAYYWSIIPASPGNPDDNMGVEPPVGDGSADDNMQVDPSVDNGSTDDNTTINPPTTGNNNSTLPQTGAATASLFGLGIASTLVGSFLRKRK